MKYIYKAICAILFVACLCNCSSDSTEDSILRPGDRDFGNFSITYIDNGYIYDAISFSLEAAINNPDDYVINVLADSFTYAKDGDSAQSFESGVVSVDNQNVITFSQDHPLKNGEGYTITYSYQLYASSTSEAELVEDNTFSIIVADKNELSPLSASYAESNLTWTISASDNATSAVVLTTINDITLSNDSFRFELVDFKDYLSIDEATGVITPCEGVTITEDVVCTPQIKVIREGDNADWTFSPAITIALTNKTYPDKIGYTAAPFYILESLYTSVQKIGSGSFVVYQDGVAMDDWNEKYKLSNKSLDNPDTKLDESSLFAIQSTGNIWTVTNETLIAGEQLLPILTLTEIDQDPDSDNILWTKSFTNPISDPSFVVNVVDQTPPIFTTLTYSATPYEWQFDSSDSKSDEPVIAYSDAATTANSLKYSLLDCEDVFDIETSTGVISLKADYTQLAATITYLPQIKVEGYNKSKELVCSAEFEEVVSITLINSDAPEFDTLTYSDTPISWEYNDDTQTKETSAPSLSYVDDQATEPTDIVYTLENYTEVFEIDATNGTISLKSDYVQKSASTEYLLGVKVVGSTNDVLVCEKLFTSAISITITNDTVAEFKNLIYDPNNYSDWVYGATSSTSEPTIEYDNKDDMFAAEADITKTYSLVSNQDVFVIDASTGKISLNTDFTPTEVSTTYTPQIKVEAKETANDEFVCDNTFDNTISITVTSNETPVISDVSYDAGTYTWTSDGNPENITSDATVTYSSLTYADSYKFSLSGNYTTGNSHKETSDITLSDVFSIDESTGALLLKANYTPEIYLDIYPEIVVAGCDEKDNEVCTYTKSTGLRIKVNPLRPSSLSFVKSDVTYTVGSDVTSSTSGAVTVTSTANKSMKTWSNRYLIVVCDNDKTTIDESEYLEVSSAGEVSIKSDKATSLNADDVLSPNFKFITNGSSEWEWSSEVITDALKFTVAAETVVPTPTPTPTITSFSYSTSSYEWEEGSTSTTDAPTIEFDNDGADGTAAYSYSFDGDSSKFEIDESTGVISLNSSYSVEADEDCTITVTAKATLSGTDYTKTATVTIKIKNVVVVVPSITSLSYTESTYPWVVGIASDSSVATPAVENLEGTTTYTYSLESDTDKFTIDSSTGLISLNTEYALADGSTTESYTPTIKVVATQDSVEKCSAEFTPVTITIEKATYRDISGVSYDPAAYTFTIGATGEATSEPTVVFKTAESNVDNGTLNFVLNNNQNVFQMDPVTGVITLKSDYTQSEDEKSYEITVKVQVVVNDEIKDTYSKAELLTITVKADPNSGTEDDFVADNTYVTFTPSTVYVNKSGEFTAPTYKFADTTNYYFHKTEAKRFSDNASTIINEESYMSMNKSGVFTFKDLAELTDGTELIPNIKVFSGEDKVGEESPIRFIVVETLP